MEFKKFFVYPRFPESLEKLVTISYNLWFTWDFDALSLFYRMDAELFRKVKHNPIKFIHLLSKEKIEALAQDRRFLLDLQEIWERFEEYQKKVHPMVSASDLTKGDVIAYFSTEFALHEALPVYAGGLGVLAGDILMGASDLDIPLVGVSLLYNRGYFKQTFDPAGLQKEESDIFDKFLNILREVKDPEGKPLLIELHILDKFYKAKVWKVEVGKRICLFLDTDIPENPPDVRAITEYLYPAEPEKRLKQEILLGMGGYQALRKMGLDPKIYHLNEGHSAFVILSRLKELMLEKGLSYPEAKLFIQETTVFTTHTPLIAGNEHFDTKLVEKYLGPEVSALGLTMEDLTKCGCILGDKSLFWLPALAIRYSRHVNAVSKLHQETTKKMWQPLFEDWLFEEVPIDYVTNGVHWRWLSEPFNDLLKEYVGLDFRFLGPDDPAWDEILNIPDEEVWEAHKKNKQRLINLLNKLLEEELMRGDPQKTSRKWSLPLKRFHLIIGCARRVTGYKRNNLILFDKERLLKILQDTDKPVLFVFAGKAHPKDLEGKKMIQELLDFRAKYQLEDKFVFIENYDLHLARYIIWGSDVWLNNPYRPMEASGTSGMKAAINGVLNLSVLDGWWAEGYDGTNGWAIYPKEGLPPYNYFEANQIYTLLEGEIRNLYYQRDEEGIPREWVQRMKRALYICCKNFSMNRVLLEYLQKFYQPALTQFKTLTAENFALVKRLDAERKILEENWGKIKILSFQTNILGEATWEDSEIEIKVEVEFGDLPKELVTVELVCIKEMGLEEEISKEFTFVPLELEKAENGKAFYSIKYQLYGHGLRKVGVRVVPSNEILRRAYPELIKWY
ncbi:alpha-glucan phosphorylase [Caldimicrobium thiodismutans]|uniref:Alpha-glucan phosphorylase n=1 Tax=Caldimicrobium thiodismutans TaxID=1653476 RepID=A0A0U5AXU8_9BACT|nr:alpha-glucan family phosphorylase [Caldimicrobium thiodismutans]BAU23279.1 alpha-glucan phosphorylase [Caldimicrobium thiodismutans]